MTFNLFGPPTKCDIKVGYVSTDRGYVSGIGIHEANLYAKQNPGTTFIFATRERIKYLKGVVKSKTAPPKCYPDVPDGKSGNYKLGVNCFYCSYKKDCWSDANNGHGLRAFEYKKGITYLTRVSRVPDVPEVRI